MIQRQDWLTGLAGLTLRQNLTGKDVSTLAVGGALPHLIEVEDLEALAQGLQRLAGLDQGFRVLGGGSNLLIPDCGNSEPIFRLGKNFRFIRALSRERFLVGAGHALMTVSRQFSEDGLSGLEFAGGIPATIGGAVFMNAGAHGSEIANTLERVRCLLVDGRMVEFSSAELNLSYRHAELPKGALVYAAEFKLTPGDKAHITETRAKYLAERKARQPLHLPSAGSVFKNISPQLTAGYLIEKAGLKGRVCGNAQISELHANWIVNPKRLARSAEVEELISMCQSEVRAQCGQDLQLELQRW